MWIRLQSDLLNATLLDLFASILLHSVRRLYARMYAKTLYFFALANGVGMR